MSHVENSRLVEFFFGAEYLFKLFDNTFCNFGKKKGFQHKFSRFCNIYIEKIELDLSAISTEKCQKCG